MRWEPKPYVLQGWALNFDEANAEVRASPEAGLADKISEAASNLCRAVAEAENTLMLRYMTDDGLKSLASMCKTELKRRTDARKNFKL